MFHARAVSVRFEDAAASPQAQSSQMEQLSSAEDAAD